MTKAERRLQRQRLPMVKLSVRCEECGWHVIVGAQADADPPALYCAWCGDRDPLVEHIKR